MARGFFLCVVKNAQFAMEKPIFSDKKKNFEKIQKKFKKGIDKWICL